MFAMKFITLLMIVGKSYGRFNLSSIPTNIHDILDQIKNEHHVNPKTQIEFDLLLGESEPYTPDFEQDMYNLNSERFEKLKKIYKMKKDNSTLGVKEESDFNLDDKDEENILRQGKKKKIKPLKKRALERALALMTQFVYEARYKMEHGQILRKTYKSVIEYKIGYCFALMRDIRSQQLFLYSTMHYNYAMHIKEYYQNFEPRWSKLDDPLFAYAYADFHSYCVLYERIVKLDVNMLDMVNLVQTLIDIRRTSSTPDPPTTPDSDSDSTTN